MNLLKYNKNFKNKKDAEVARILGISQAMLGQMKRNKTFPSILTLKNFFFKTNGKMKPNDFFPLDEWKKELKESKTKKENYEES